MASQGHSDKDAPNIVCGYPSFRVQAKDRKPLIKFMCRALEAAGCRIIRASPPTIAPFRITFETPSGLRQGIVAYAFRANSRPTRNRPLDEHRFQIKYGSKPIGEQVVIDLWQDPFGLYTTLLLGINPEEGFFVGADPVLHSPTKLFISLEFKERHAEEIRERGWYVWERDRRSDDEPTEVLVGGTAGAFLRYIEFERSAVGLDQGHRQLLGEKMAEIPVLPGASAPMGLAPGPRRLHQLAREFEMKEEEVLDLIAQTRRLKMAVRGWVAEEHLLRHLSKVKGVSECERLDKEGSPDIRLRFEGGRPITVECKNVLRNTTRDGLARVDFQRTRASLGDPCSRYYAPTDFDVIAACLHAVSERWEFRFVLPSQLDPHPRCPGKIGNNVRIDKRWKSKASPVLRAATG